MLLSKEVFLTVTTLPFHLGNYAYFRTRFDQKLIQTVSHFFWKTVWNFESTSIPTRSRVHRINVTKKQVNQASNDMLHKDEVQRKCWFNDRFI